MTRDEAHALFSEYLDGALDEPIRARLEAYLEATPAIRAELDAFARTLDTLHALPPREPSLDLWREFAPHMAAYQAERRLSLAARLRTRWSHALSDLSAGLILWTHSLAARTHARLERYLLRDPLALPRFGPPPK